MSDDFTHIFKATKDAYFTTEQDICTARAYLADVAGQYDIGRMIESMLIFFDVE
jgi:hypothetical protein